jgi:hypothetical protein
MGKMLVLGGINTANLTPLGLYAHIMNLAVNVFFEQEGGI